jgi:beta-phosphoglucomutase-like phosphatase (HAD superfamily)
VEVSQGKPSPQIFQVACRRLGAAPDQCLVFEDSLAGVQAARAAGMSVCAVVPHSASSELRRCLEEVAVREHDAVVASLVEVDLARWGHKDVLLLS